MVETWAMALLVCARWLGHKYTFDHVRHSLPSQKEKKKEEKKHSLTADVQENRSVSKR